MTLEEYTEWKKSGEKRKVRHADIVKMFIDKSKAEAVLGHVLLEEFNAKYGEEIHSNKAYIMTANSFPGIIKKILGNFPCWEKYINRNNEIIRELFKLEKEKQKKVSFGKWLLYYIMFAIMFNIVQGIFKSSGFIPLITSTTNLVAFTYGAIDTIIEGLFAWSLNKALLNRQSSKALIWIAHIALFILLSAIIMLVYSNCCNG